MGIPLLYGLVFNAICAIPTLKMPGVADSMVVLAAGLLGAVGQLLLLYTSRNTPAFAVSQAQYSQLIWAALIGAVFFRELPDAYTVAGLAVILAAGLATVAATRMMPRAQAAGTGAAPG